MKKLLPIIIILLTTQTVQAQWIKTSCPVAGGATAFAVSGASVFVSMHGGKIYYSPDTGNTWMDRSITGLSVHPPVFAICQHQSNVFAGTAGKGIYLSADNGQSWTPANNGLPAADTINYLVAIGDTIYAATYTGVYYSTDNGANWMVRNTGLPAGAGAWTIIARDNYIFTATLNGDGVFRTGSTGGNWQAVNNGLTNMNVAAMAAAGNRLFAGTFGGGVFVSSDNGDNWTALNTGLTDLDIATLAPVGNSILVGTFGNGVFLLNETATQWIDMSTGLSPKSTFSSGTDGTTVFIGTGGGVMKRTQAHITSVKTTTTKTGAKIYPTAGNGIFNIEMKEGLSCELNIFNLSGSIVYTGHISGGLHTVDISHVPRGCYMVNIKTNTATETIQVTLQ